MTSHALRKFVVVGIAAWAGPSLAKTGCESVGVATYQLGTEYEQAGVTVPGDASAGEVVGRGSARKSGASLVLRCWKGRVTFHHDWAPASGDKVRSLTIGGRPSGLGLRATVGGSPYQQFSYPAVTNGPDGGSTGPWIPIGPTVTNLSGEWVTYELVRLAGPLLFGRLDGGVVARSAASHSSGGGRINYRDLLMSGVVVNRPACSIVVGDLDQVVKLPRYTLRDFGNAEQATPWFPFDFRVASCPNPSGLIARFTFGVKADGAAANDQWFSLPASGPKQVAMQVGTGDFANVAPGTPVQIAALGDGERYTFNARLRRTGANMQGGSFSRPLRLMVEFL